MHEATSKFTDALRFFLATPTPAPAGGHGHGQRDMKRRFSLRFYQTKHHHRLLEIGRLLSGAVGRGEVQALSIVVVDTVEDISYQRQHGNAAAADGSTVVGLRYARRFLRLFRAAPAAVVASLLTQLELRNLCFRRASDLESVLRACKALETLRLDGYWFLAGAAAAWSSALRIDAPRSRLGDLRIAGCDVESVHLVSLPRLRRLGCERWSARACPVTFGPASAPALKRVTLVNRWAPGQVSFKLSDLQLENANPVEYLRLDFNADNVLLLPP